MLRYNTHSWCCKRGWTRELQDGDRKAETYPVRDRCLVQISNKVGLCLMERASEVTEGLCNEASAYLVSQRVQRPWHGEGDRKREPMWLERLGAVIGPGARDDRGIFSHEKQR